MGDPKPQKLDSGKELKSQRAEMIKENLTKFSNLLAEISKLYEGLGIKLDSHARISMDESKDYFLGSQAHEKLENRLAVMNRNQDKLGLAELRLSQSLENRLEASPGEALEILKTIVFNKFLSSKYVVVRASSYDDWITGVDNVIMHKESGEIVCALDEMTKETTEENIKSRLNEMLERNQDEGGITLEHGYVKDKKRGFVPTRVSYIPVFYLTLPFAETIVAASQIGASLSEINEYDQETFETFRKLLTREISNIQTWVRNERGVRERLKESSIPLDVLETRMAKLRTLEDAMREAMKTRQKNG